MTWELLVKLVGEIAWPAVAAVAVLLFRGEVIGLIQRIREFKRGDLQFKLDPAKVAEIVAKGRDLPAIEVARQIEQQAVVDTGERRILRALITEDDGRQLNSYKQNYRPALDRLLAAQRVRKENGKYYITPLGLDAARPHLSQAL